MQNKPRILLLTNQSGTAFWRVATPLQTLYQRNAIDLTWIDQSDRMPQDYNWLAGHDMMIVHQMWDDRARIHCQFFVEALHKPLIVSLDDLIIPHLIPDNITGKQFYADPGIIQNAKAIMDMANTILVTTPVLSINLAKYFDLPIRKFRSMPNLPAYNWLGRYFDPRGKAARWQMRKQQHAPMRIGLIGSLSHYNTDGRQVRTDMDVIVDTMAILHDRKLDGKYMWCTQKQTTLQVPDYAKLEQLTPQVVIQDYPQAVASMDLDVVVVPLMDSEFNGCKSNIKILETAALGIPCLTQQSPAYDAYQPHELIWQDATTLADRLEWLSSWTSDKYMRHIIDRYNAIYATQTEYCGIKLNGYFMEQNIPLLMDVLLSPLNPQPPAPEQITPPPLK